MVVFPNAKINIGLNIVEKRNDGFHNIESIFYPVFQLYDVLEIVENKSTKNLEFTSTGISIPDNGNTNLCINAYRLLQEDFHLPSVHIHLHKVIPIGAGLGGGSSDAAFTLKALNDLFELNIKEKDLISYARRLGSDCAFFINNKPAYASERGDIVEAIDLDLENYNIRVNYPNIHIGTKEAYSGVVPNLSKDKLTELIDLPLSNWREKIKNDFEKSIFSIYPEIGKLKEKMYEEGAVYASMTGSGSAVYGIFSTAI